VPSDPQLRSALDRLLTTVRARWEEDLRLSADDVALAAEADAQEAVERAVQAAQTRSREEAHAEIESGISRPIVE
jgi:predicted ATPase